MENRQPDKIVPKIVRLTIPYGKSFKCQNSALDESYIKSFIYQLRVGGSNPLLRQLDLR